jgi:hypothetical protein
MSPRTAPAESPARLESIPCSAHLERAVGSGDDAVGTVPPPRTGVVMAAMDPP